jgi:hypothetical protein
MKYFIIFFSIIIFNSCDNNGEKPFNCTNQIIIDQFLKNEDYFSLGFKIPESWDCEMSKKPDNSYTKVCLDTLILNEKGLLNLIGVSKFPFKQKRSLLVIEENIKEIQEDKNMKYIGNGQQKIKGILVDWISYKDETSYHITYYLFQDDYTLINVTAFLDSYEQGVLCKTISYLN